MFVLLYPCGVNAVENYVSFSRHCLLPLVFPSSSSAGGSGQSIRQSSFITSGCRSWSSPSSTIPSSLFWGEAVWKKKQTQPSKEHTRSPKRVVLSPLRSSVRTCFTTIALSYLPVWLTLDYLSDLMYMTDMIITAHTGAFSPWYSTTCLLCLKWEDGHVLMSVSIFCRRMFLHEKYDLKLISIKLLIMHSRADWSITIIFGCSSRSCYLLSWIMKPSTSKVSRNQFNI